MKKKPNGWNEMRLNHSIFQTEVQFNAPTSSKHLAGAYLPTSHPQGKPPLHQTQFIIDGNQFHPFGVSPARFYDGCTTCTVDVPPSWKPTYGGASMFKTKEEAKNWAKSQGHWIDGTSEAKKKAQKKIDKKKRAKAAKRFKRKWKWSWWR